MCDHQVFDVGSVLSMNYADATFDAVLINQVVQHLEDDASRPHRGAMTAALKECYRVLKPGGVVVISTRNKAPTYDSHYWYVTQSEGSQELDS